MSFEVQPYLLHNQIQHYAWGTQGTEAFIPYFLGLPVKENTPYAELWMGAHPKASSSIQLTSKRITLNAWVNQHSQAILGKQVAADFENTWPFLFKILSIATPLSIQAHPNKTQAQALHARDPKHYPDANHKPEIAIALSELTALVGFKDFADIVTTLTTYPEIADFIGDEIVAGVLQTNGNPSTQCESVRQLWTTLMQRAEADKAALTQTITHLTTRLTAFPTPSEHERLFLNARQIYTGADIGLLALFFLNLIHLKRGQGIFLKPGIPHAYVKGNIIECMANSDNVVRVGLTPKFKDVTTLIDILTYELGAPPILGESDTEAVTTYSVPAPEFQVQRWQLNAGDQQTYIRPETPAIWLIIEGKIEIGWGTNSVTFSRGQSILLPATLQNIELIALQDVEIFIANVPVKN